MSIYGDQEKWMLHKPILLHGIDSFEPVKYENKKVNGAKSTTETPSTFRLETFIHELQQMNSPTAASNRSIKRFDFKKSMLKAISTPRSLEEDIRYRHRLVDYAPKHVTIRLIDCSRSMQQKLPKTLPNDESPVYYLYHNHQMYAWSHSYLYPQKFTGTTSFANTYDLLIKILQTTSIRFHIQHVSDGEISTNEFHRVDRIFKELENRKTHTYTFQNMQPANRESSYFFEYFNQKYTHTSIVNFKDFK